MGEDDASVNLWRRGVYGSGELNPWTVDKRREAKINFISVILVAIYRSKADVECTQWRWQVKEERTNSKVAWVACGVWCDGLEMHKLI